MTQSRNSVDALNALRAYATFIVYMLHATIFLGAVDPQIFLLQTPAWAGVWILVVLSGYLIGKGFFQGRYTHTRKYLLNRFLRVGIPFYLFNFLLLSLLYPEFAVANPMAIARILTFTYNGVPGVNGVGATWFVSMIMQLYFLAPLAFALMKKLAAVNNKKIAACCMAFLFAGFLALRLWLMNTGADWQVYVYTFSLSNLDLFFCGFLLNAFTRGRDEKSISPAPAFVLKFISVLLILVLTGVLSYCNKTGGTWGLFYRYGAPSTVLAGVGLYLYAFDYRRAAPNEKLSFHAVLKNPARLIDYFSAVSLWFYFWHSNILEKITPLIRIDSIVWKHLAVLFVCGLITLALAAVFYNLVDRPLAEIKRRNNGNPDIKP